MPRSAHRQDAHRRPLTREKIASAAIEIVRAEGAEALSMRKVAAVFGVDVAALYRHVRNKEELLAETGRLASERVALEAPAPATGNLEERIVALCTELRDRVVRHPELGIHGESSPLATPFFARANGLIADLLHEAGLEGPALVHGTQSLLHLVGSVAQSEVLMRATPAKDNRAFAQSVHASLSDEVRAVWPATRREHRWSVDFDAFFDLGVRALLRGLLPAATDGAR